MHGRHDIHRRRMRWLIGAVSAVVVMAGAAIGFRLWLTDTPRAITAGEAVDRFRTSSTLPARAGTPSAGVYLYSTLGSESVDALSGDTHLYPAETTITVTPTACGYDLTWTPLSGRSNSYTLCAVGTGLRQAGTVNEHSFFRLTRQETFRCDEQSWWLPPAGVTEWTSVCRSPDRTSTRTSRVVGTDDVTVGGAQDAAVHVHIDDTISGGSTGASTTDLWLDPDTGLPLRMAGHTATQNDSPIGSVSFEDDWQLTLISQDPRR